MLAERIVDLTPLQRKFLLLRAVGFDKASAMEQCEVKKGQPIKQGTYNKWLTYENFIEAYRFIRSGELTAEDKREAIKLLRRDNQLSAVLLEEEVITQIRAEIVSGNYVLLKTALAKEVYQKLIGDLDVPTVKHERATWEQNILALVNPPKQLEEANAPTDYIEAEFREA